MRNAYDNLRGKRKSKVWAWLAYMSQEDMLCKHEEEYKKKISLYDENNEQ